MVTKIRLFIFFMKSRYITTFAMKRNRNFKDKKKACRLRQALLDFKNITEEIKLL